MNPFGAVGSRQSEVVSPETGQILSVKAPLNKGLRLEGSARKGNEGGIFETRRADLRPEVRRYADKLYAEIKKLYATYGVQNAAELFAKAKARQISVPKEDAKRLLRLQNELQTVLERKALPEGYTEYPSYEAIKKTVDEINKLVAPERVTCLGRWEDYELIDGKLNGSVEINWKWLPLLNGELVREIEGKKISYGECVNVNGKLNGMVVFDGRWLPVLNGALVRTFEGMEIKKFDNVRVVGGMLNGSIEIGDKWLPVLNGVLVREVEGHEIVKFDDVRNVDGKLNGRFKVESQALGGHRIGGRWLPVIDGRFVHTIDNLEIEDCEDIRNIDGRLNGKVKVGRYYIPVLDDVPIRKIDNQDITGCHSVRNVDGKLNGIVRIRNLWLPVIDGKVIRQIDGLDIEMSDVFVFGEAGGVLSGRVNVIQADGSKVERDVVLGKFVD